MSSSLNLWTGKYNPTPHILRNHPHINQTLLSSSFKDARHHQFLLDFLKSAGRCYLEQGRAKDFIMDLMELNVPDLFTMDTEGSTSTIQSDIMSSSVPEDFTQFLADYIQRHHLHEALLKDVEKIWVCTYICGGTCL